MSKRACRGGRVTSREIRERELDEQEIGPDPDIDRLVSYYANRYRQVTENKLAS